MLRFVVQSPRTLARAAYNPSRAGCGLVLRGRPSLLRNSIRIRKATTEATQTANKVQAQPVGRVQLLFTNVFQAWNRLSWAERWQKAQRYLIVGGTIFSCTVVVQMFYKTSMWAVNITAYQAFMWGAAVGGVSSAVLVMSAVSIRQMFQVRPDPIYRLVLKFLNRDERVVKALGKPLKTGKFRAYRYETKFPTQKLQLMFDLIGSQRDGACSVEVSRNLRGAYDFQLLAVDIHGTGERILLSGDGARELSGAVKGLK